ncbi:MAG: hypothetical protein EHM41_13080 [Chloroflexi bacterium]|nr:MAG: hypothetical protein EHM41_13080 [Chloroflexota bacterium]
MAQKEQNPQDREKVISNINEMGFDDYYSVLPYVQERIYRAHKGDYIVDAIWSNTMPVFWTADPGSSRCYQRRIQIENVERG